MPRPSKFAERVRVDPDGRWWCKACRGHQLRKTPKAVNSHYARVHDPSRVLQCLHCEHKDSQGNLPRHVEIYHVSKEGSHKEKCPNCPNSWYSNHSRRQHVQNCFETLEPIATSGQGRSFDLQAGNPFVDDGPAESPVVARQTARGPISEKATYVDGTWQCKYCEFKPTTRQGVHDHFLTHFPTGRTSGRTPCEYCNDNPTKKNYGAHYRNIHDPTQNEPKAEAGFKVKCEDCKQAWHARGNKAEEAHRKVCPVPGGVLREGWRKDRDTGKFVRDNGDEAPPAGLSKSGNPEVLNPASPLTIESRRRQHVGTYLRDGTPGSSSPIPQVTSLDESSRRSGEFRAFEDPSASRQNDPDTDVSDWPSSLDPIQDSGREHRRRTRTNDRNPHVPKARRARPHTRSTVVPHPPRSSPDTVTPTRRNTPQFIEVPYKQFFDEIFQDPTPASPKSLSKRFSSLHLSSRKSHQYPDLL